MYNHELLVGENDAVLVSQGRGSPPDKFEEPVAAGRDMRAMLDVLGGPVSRRSLVVPLVEEGIEGFEHKRLVRLFKGVRHLVCSVLVDPCPCFGLRLSSLTNVSDRGLCEREYTHPTVDRGLV